MHKGLSLFLLLLLTVTSMSAAVFAEEDGWTLTREDMMNKDKVIVYLDHYPKKVQYLPEEVVAGLLHYIEYQESVTFGADLRLLHRVQFNLEMRMLDIRLEKLLHGKTFKPEGYEPEKEDYHDKGAAKHDKDGYIVNEAEVTAEGPMGTVVYDDDKAKVMAMHPSIAIEKSPDKQVVVSGKAVEFAVTVTNTGDVELHNIKVMDPQAPDCERSIKYLAPGETAHYYCETIVHGDIHNVINVTGYDPHRGAVVDTDEAFVDAINPSIKIEKTVDKDWVVAGRPAIFTITVTNTGDVPLYKVNVSDPMVPDCERMIDHLGVLESISWDCVFIVEESMEYEKHSVEHRRIDDMDEGRGPQREHEERGHAGGRSYKSERPYGYSEIVHTDTFASQLGCDLHMSLAVLETMGSGLYVGPCEVSDDGYWTFTVWKAS